MNENRSGGEERSSRPPTAEPAILVEGLRKRFGAVVALDGIDLAVAPGTVFGLLGPNGTGKTTAVRILTTILSPDAGRALVLGHDVSREAPAVRLRIGLAGQFAAVDGNLTGRENLELIGRTLMTVLRALDGRDLAPTRIAVREPSLDDVFLALTGHKGRARRAPGLRRRSSARAPGRRGMTAPAVPVGLNDDFHRRGRLTAALADIAAVTGRNLIAYRRVPRLVVSRRSSRSCSCCSSRMSSAGRSGTSPGGRTSTT